MISTREIARVLEAAERVEAKVVVVGDPKQLPAIEAGGWFEMLVDRIGASRLTENLRQKDPAEREILDAMAAGEMAKAFDRALSSDRIVPCASEDQACTQLVDEWMQSEHRRSSLILASTNREVDKLNDLCRRAEIARVAEHGELAVDPTKHLLPSEPVIFRANIHQLGVTNRERGLIERDDPADDYLVVRMRGDDRLVQVPRSVASDRTKFAPGYASTIHVGQGTTVDACFMLASGPMSREHIYVGFSRGRYVNKLFATEHAFENEAGFDIDIDPRTERQLRASFERKSAEPAAVVVTGDRDLTKTERTQMMQLRRLLRARSSEDRLALVARLEPDDHSRDSSTEKALSVWIKHHKGDIAQAHGEAFEGKLAAQSPSKAASAGRRLGL